MNQAELTELAFQMADFEGEDFKSFSDITNVRELSKGPFDPTKKDSKNSQEDYDGNNN